MGFGREAALGDEISHFLSVIRRRGRNFTPQRALFQNAQGFGNEGSAGVSRAGTRNETGLGEQAISFDAEAWTELENHGQTRK
jgi:hypothetical protein